MKDIAASNKNISISLSGHLRMVEILLEHYSMIDSQTLNGYTAVQVASQNG